MCKCPRRSARPSVRGEGRGRSCPTERAALGSVVALRGEREGCLYVRCGMRVLHGDGLRVGRRYFPWIQRAEIRSWVRRSACLLAEHGEGAERALCSGGKGRVVPSLQRKGFCLPKGCRPLHFSSPASGAGSEQLLSHSVPPGPVAKT